MVTEDDRIALERLLAGDLPAEEAEQLHARIAQDVPLGDAWAQMADTEQWMLRSQNARATVARFKKTVASPEESKAWYRGKFLMIAAAVLVLLSLLVGAIWWLSEEEVIDHRPLAVAEMSEGASPAVTAYNRGDYATALPLLENLNQDTLSSIYLLAEGVSHLETGGLQEALATFGQLKEEGGVSFRPAASFYLALTHYRLGDMEAASANLENVPANTYYSTAADRLRKKI